VVPVLSWG